jgi:KaiC/GvpD/RAD55 family RecA-like ATPase
LRAGIPKGNVILMEGAAGTGKTLLGMEFIYRGVTRYNEPGLIVSFEVAPWKLIRDAANFGWDLETLQQQNRLKLLFTSPQVLSQELNSPDSLLLGCRAFLSCISKGFGGFCSRLLRLRTGKLSSAFRLHGFANIF